MMDRTQEIAQIRWLADSIYSAQTVTPFEYHNIEEYLDDLVYLANDQGWLSDIAPDLPLAAEAPSRRRRPTSVPAFSRRN